MKKMFVLFAAFPLLFSCKKDKDQAGTFKGAEMEVYHGKSWSSVKLDKEGNPEQLTLTLDSNVLRTVFVGSGTPDHTHENHIIVPLHDKAVEKTPFKFVLLDWNPTGHEPAGVYDA